MSETRKRTLGADMIDLSVPWCKRIDPTHLIAKPVEQHPPRPSTLAAEGGAERETTNSPAEIGTACTGRKKALVVWVLAMLLMSAYIGLALWAIGSAWGAFALLVGALFLVPADALLWVLVINMARGGT